MTIEDATNVTIEDAIKTFELLVFSQDFSPSALRAKAINELVLAALRTQLQENKPLTLEELRDTARESREIAQVFNMVADIIEQKILPSDWRNADHADDAPGEVAS